MLERNALSRALHALDHVAPQPAGFLTRVRRDDDLVGTGLELSEGVAERCDRIRLDHEPRGMDAGLAQRLKRAFQPTARGGAPRVLVDHVALARLVDRGDNGHPQRALLGAPLQRVDQALAGDRLVRDHQDVALFAHRTGTSSETRSPLKTACRAPGTPYSYGLPTTCGISSKLKIGGGELTCHSSVSERHGFAGARAPKRQLVIML